MNVGEVGGDAKCVIQRMKLTRIRILHTDTDTDTLPNLHYNRLKGCA